MKGKDLLKTLTDLFEEHPEYLEHEVAQQDCFSSPYAFIPNNIYIGTYYETENGGFLDKEEVNPEDEILKEFPVVVIENF